MPDAFTSPSPASSPPERLNRQIVVDAALRVARQEGVAALSMRRLAEELGVSTMAAYRHVTSKETLVEDLLEATLLRISLETSAERWDEQIVELVLRSYRAFLATPGLADHLRGRALSRPGSIRWLEALNDPLITAGIPHAYRAGFSSALLWMLTGAARLEEAWSETAPALEEVLADGLQTEPGGADDPGAGQSVAELFLRRNLELLTSGLDAAVQDG